MEAQETNMSSLGGIFSGTMPDNNSVAIWIVRRQTPENMLKKAS